MTAAEELDASLAAAARKMTTAIGITFGQLMVMCDGSAEQAEYEIRKLIDEAIRRMTDSAVVDVVRSFLANGAVLDAKTLTDEMVRAFASKGGRS